MIVDCAVYQDGKRLPGELALHEAYEALGDVRRRIESRPDLLRFGPGAVLYGILDQVVDDYQPVIDGLDADIKEVETEVFSRAGSNPAERIYLLKREVIEFHQATAPLTEPLDRLVHSLVPGVPGELGEYYRAFRRNGWL